MRVPTFWRRVVVTRMISIVANGGSRNVIVGPFVLRLLRSNAGSIISFKGRAMVKDRRYPSVLLVCIVKISQEATRVKVRKRQLVNVTKRRVRKIQVMRHAMKHEQVGKIIKTSMTSRRARKLVTVLLVGTVGNALYSPFTKVGQGVRVELATLTIVRSIVF